MISFRTYINHNIKATRIGIATGRILQQADNKRKKMNTDDFDWTKLIADATRLLDDKNLVWSEDFELIRKDLSWYIYMNPGETAARLIAAKIVLHRG